MTFDLQVAFVLYQTDSTNCFGQSFNMLCSGRAVAPKLRSPTTGTGHSQEKIDDAHTNDHTDRDPFAMVATVTGDRDDRRLFAPDPALDEDL